MKNQTAFDTIIIGAGIVGLATALQLLRKTPNRKILIIEKESAVAQHQSSHNSGVIHSGIYYQPGSLKATNCQRGYKWLLEFCEEHDIPFEICGKLIVACDESERPQLQKIYQKGVKNGLTGIEIIGQEAIKEIEPHVNAVAAIRVPQAGITDYLLVAEKYAELFQAKGGQIEFNHKVVNIEQSPQNVIVQTTKGEFKTTQLINCGGLYSDQLAKLSSDQVPIQIIPFRGEYYELKAEKNHLVKHLIYPVPNPNFPFLGVHFTRMIHGGIEAGPNAVLAFKREGYNRWQIHIPELVQTLQYPGFHSIARKYWREGWMELQRSFSKRKFVTSMQRLIPEITAEDVVRGRSGVRATACGANGELADDYILVQQENILHILNAPSPAATSSLSIGDWIASKALKITQELI